MRYCMDIHDFITAMEEVAPPELAEEYDTGRIGLVVEGKREVRTICCALDATQNVVEAAAAMKAAMLVVHHTPLWSPITAVRGPTSHLLRILLATGMNLYVMHTNVDHAEGGVNDILASYSTSSDRANECRRRRRLHAQPRRDRPPFPGGGSGSMERLTLSGASRS